MKVLSSVLVFVLTWLQTKGDLFPQGNQWKYLYHGVVTTGSVIKFEAISQWDLQAVMEISARNGIVQVQLSNFNSSLYNGPKDKIPTDLHPTDVPNNAAVPLSLPFILNYNDVNLESINFDENDPLWSVNIKRAIASIFQLNLNNLNIPASYISENNLYGFCKSIAYSVRNTTDFILIQKVIDHTKCNDYPTHNWSSTPKFNCQNDIEGPTMSNTVRDYSVSTKDGYYEIVTIKSQRHLYSQPFRANGEIQHSYQYQNFQLISKSSLTDSKNITKNTIKKSIIYEHNITDLTHGRFMKKEQQEGIIGAINALLDEVVTNLEEKHLDKNVVDFHRELMFLYYNLFPVHKKNLEKIYADLSLGTSYQQETKRSIFLELLPQVGSEDSVNFMKDLIVNNELKQITAIKLLSMFPLYVKQHSEKLLRDMEVLLTLNDKYDRSIRHTAVLSFATLVYQTFTTGKCHPETLENYALKYFDLFAESENYEDKMLYLQGLDNLQLGPVSKYLKSIVENVNQSRHIRFLAVWAALRINIFKQEKVYETYWPILTNRTEDVEMRIAALLTLMLSQPNKTRLLTLYWYMQAEPNLHLYNFFYTTLKSLHKSHYPCFKQLAKISGHVIRFLPRRNSQNLITGNYIVDYSDSESSFGTLLQLFIIGNSDTNIPNVIKFKVKNYAAKSTMNQVTIYLKLQGVAHHVWNIFKETATDLKNLDKIINMINLFNIKPDSTEDVHIEMIVKVHEKSVFCSYIDGNTLNKITEVMKHAHLMVEYHLNHQSIIVPYTREYMEPTDMGTLLIKALVSNSIASTRGSLTSQTVDGNTKYDSDIDFRYYTYTTSFLELYNPISEMWHGMERGKKLQTKFLFNTTMLIDKEQSKIELIQHDNNDADEEYISILLHSHSYTYLISNGTIGILQYHCPLCDNIYNITQGKIQDQLQILDTSFNKNETKLEINIFDCDSYNEIKNIFHFLHISHQYNSEILPIAKPLLYIFHYLDYVSYIPCHGRCGASLAFKSGSNNKSQLKYDFIVGDETKITTDKTKLKYELSGNLRQTPEAAYIQLWNTTMLWTLNFKTKVLNTLIVFHNNESEDDTSLCLSSDLDLQNDWDIYNILKHEEKEISISSLNCSSFEKSTNSFVNNIVRLLNGGLHKLT